jgi:hypothetical protein
MKRGREFFQPNARLVAQCVGKTLYPTEQRREADGTLRVLYAARIADCRSCRLRKQCQWHGRHTKKPRRVSMLIHPLQGGSAPLLWRDWSRREHRRACMKLLRHQRVDIQLGPPSQDKPDPPPATFSRLSGRITASRGMSG